MFHLIGNVVAVKLSHRRTTSSDVGLVSDSSPPHTRVTSTIPHMHASSVSETQNRQDDDVVGDNHRW